MRKYFLSLVAMAAMILFSGCNKNEDFYISENGDMVTFNIATPEMGTRAFSDGTTANKLIVAVYNDQKEHLPQLLKEVPINGSTTVQLPLVTGIKYNILFWAYPETGSPYSFNPDKGEVKVNYDGVTANNEKLDAFMGKELNYVVTGPASKTVYLTRPFAQLNVATKDYNDAVNSGIVIEKTSIKVEKAYNTLNLFNGEVSGEQTIELAQDLTPMENGQELQGYEDYSWLSMNYILVDGQTTVTATMGTDNQNVTRSWTFIPIQRNYRTNILGNILTTTTDFNVVIEEGFAGESTEWDGTSISEPKQDQNGIYQIYDASNLAWLAAAVNGTLPATKSESEFLPAQSFEGKTFVLNTDIDLCNHNWTPISMPEKLEPKSTFRGTFDGNGHIIKGLTVNQQKAAGLFGYLYGATIKNVIIDGATINSNHYAGGIVAWVLNNSGNQSLPMVIENCHVQNSKITSAAEQVNGAWDNGDKVGGIVGYACFSNEENKPIIEGAKISNCSVKSTTIQAYRDFGGVIGYAERIVMSNTTVQEITLTQDLDHDYKNPTPTTFGELIGKSVGKNIVDGAEFISGSLTSPLELSGNYIFDNVTSNHQINVVGDTEIEVRGKVEVTTESGNAISVEGDKTLVVKGNKRNTSFVVKSKAGSGISGNVIFNGVNGISAEGNGNHAFGIGANNATVRIINSTVDYACGGHVQPLFINDEKYGKSEPEGAPAIGGAVIEIVGSTIKRVNGGSKAAAIGAQYWQSTEITIENSTILEANGGNASAGIGGSRYNEDISANNKQVTKIKIENSVVNATGGQAGAGIGAGYDTHCKANNTNAINDIIIVNSTINAQGGKYAAGIGTGFHSAALTGSIDEASTISAFPGDAIYKNTYTTAQNIGYGVIDPEREGANLNVTFKFKGEVITNPIQ